MLLVALIKCSLSDLSREMKRDEAAVLDSLYLHRFLSAQQDRRTTTTRRREREQEQDLRELHDPPPPEERPSPSGASQLACPIQQTPIQQPQPPDYSISILLRHSAPHKQLFFLFHYSPAGYTYGERSKPRAGLKPEKIQYIDPPPPRRHFIPYHKRK